MFCVEFLRFGKCYVLRPYKVHAVIDHHPCCICPLCRDDIVCRLKNNNESSNKTYRSLSWRHTTASNNHNLHFCFSIAALMDIVYISRSSVVRPTLHTSHLLLHCIQSSTCLSQCRFGLQCSVYVALCNPIRSLLCPDAARVYKIIVFGSFAIEVCRYFPVVSASSRPVIFTVIRVGFCCGILLEFFGLFPIWGEFSFSTFAGLVFFAL